MPLPSITSQLVTDNRLYITSEDESIIDRAFKDISGIQPTRGIMFAQTDKISLLLDSRYFHGAHEKLDGTSIEVGEKTYIVSVIKVEKTMDDIISKIDDILEGDTKEIQIGTYFPIGIIHQIQIEAKKKGITVKFIGNHVDPKVIDDSLQIIQDAPQEKEAPKGQKKLYLTDEDSSVRDDHFFYYLGYQPQKGAMLIQGDTIHLVLPEAEKTQCKIDEKHVESRFGRTMKLHCIFLEPGSTEQILENTEVSPNASLSLSDNLTFEQLIQIQDILGDTIQLELNRPDFDIQRIKKQPDEIRKYNEAVAIIEEVWKRLCYDNERGMLEGMTEKEIQDLLRHYISEGGGEEEAFTTLVAFGANGAVPHHIPGETNCGNTMIGNGPLLIDMGARYQGYCSDMTRCLWVGKKEGEVYDQYQEISHVVEGAHQAVLDYFYTQDFSRGIKYADLHSVAYNFIENSLRGKYKGKFIHGLGHGVGIRIHEKPYVNFDGTQEIEENIIFSIEPGIYVPGLMGIRLENTYVVQKGELITPHNLPLRTD